jgi:hypothetical protein
MDKHQVLGDYLRARREHVRPEDVGLVPGGRRRVPGLRRDELAMLAGISTDYYLRLEQGRNQTPSPQVLDALAAVLQLDADSTAYLHDLATADAQRRPTRRPDRVPTGTLQFLEALAMPAFVHDKRLTVLAANPFATALCPSYRVGVNLLRAVFLDPAEHELRRDWDRAATEAVAGIRAVSASALDDPELGSLVGELSVKSDTFRRLWARHDVRKRAGGTSLLQHPEVGPLELRHEKLTVAGTDGQTLVAYHAEPGTTSAEALALLGSIAATDRVARPRAAPHEAEPGRRAVDPWSPDGHR